MATKINLRKAAALQNVLQDLIRGINVDANIRINEFQDAAATIVEANKTMLINDARRNDLLMSIYSLRSLVGTQNAMVGISSKLSHAAYIDKRVAQLQSLIDGANKPQALEVIVGKLEKIRNRVEGARHSLYNEDEVPVGVMSAEQINEIKNVIRDLKKQKQTLNDEVLELNVRTEIELTPDVEAVLSRENVI
jgi:hypothetical protein